MRIGRFKADNFKSLLNFELRLAKFTCLIGLNGAGKSTVLQFLDFLARQVRGDIKGWLDQRGWESSELISRLSTKQNIEFSVSLLDDSEREVASWQGSFNSTHLRCTTERITVADAELRVDGRRYTISANDGENGRGRERITFKYEGSLLSQLREDDLPKSLRDFKQFFENVNSLDLLSPQYLRQRFREAEGSLGMGGQRLSAFLHELDSERRQKLNDQLKKVYKQLNGVETKSLRSGSKLLNISEAFGGEEITTEARHINDGMLRLMAILAALQTEHQFVLFDEVENGINPELIEFVLDSLISAPQQVLVTTHSPMILNYLNDDVAKAGVMYLYKTKKGHTKAIPFFSIPSLARKLTVMGPGEAFVDTHLAALGDEIKAIADEK